MEQNKIDQAKKERKCEICNCRYANVLDTIDATFQLCPNHLITFVTRTLTAKEARQLIKTHGRAVYLDHMLYDEKGHTMQPIC